MMFVADLALWKEKFTIAVASLDAGSIVALVTTELEDMLVGMAHASMPVGTNVEPLTRRNWPVCRQQSSTFGGIWKPPLL